MADYNKAKLKKFRTFSETKIMSLSNTVLKRTLNAPLEGRICSGNIKKPLNLLSKIRQKDSPKKPPEVKSKKSLKKYQWLSLRVNLHSAFWKKITNWKKRKIKPLKRIMIAKKRIQQVHMGNYRLLTQW